MKTPLWTHWPRRIAESFVEGPFCQRLGSFASVLFSDRPNDYIGEDNLVQLVDAFVDFQDLVRLEFEGAATKANCRPEHYPATLQKTYLYESPNLARPCRRLKREAQHDEQPMGLTRQLVPNLKTIADFRRDYGAAKPNHNTQFESFNGPCRDEFRLKSASLSHCPPSCISTSPRSPGNF